MYTVTILPLEEIERRWRGQKASGPRILGYRRRNATPWWTARSRSRKWLGKKLAFRGEPGTLATFLVHLEWKGWKQVRPTHRSAVWHNQFGAAGKDVTVHLSLSRRSFASAPFHSLLWDTIDRAWPPQCITIDRCHSEIEGSPSSTLRVGVTEGNGSPSLLST